MSRTNSKARKEQNPTEFYPTPPECTEALLRNVYLPVLGRPKRWLEPCAGSGAIIKAATAFWRKEQQKDKFSLPVWDINEIDNRHRPAISALTEDLGEFGWGQVSIGDARVLKSGGYDVAITNPPFSLAGEILSALRPLAEYTVLLLRVGFLEAAKRFKWLSQDMPDVGILIPRPQFTNQGHDSATYAWMIWGPKRQSQGKIFLLPCRDELTRDNQPSLFQEAA